MARLRQGHCESCGKSDLLTETNVGEADDTVWLCSDCGHDEPEDWEREESGFSPRETSKEAGDYMAVTPPCPFCDSPDTAQSVPGTPEADFGDFVCDNCGETFEDPSAWTSSKTASIGVTGTNWTLDGLPIEGGFDVTAEEQDPAWMFDIGMFSMASKTASRVEAEGLGQGAPMDQMPCPGCGAMLPEMGECPNCVAPQSPTVAPEMGAYGSACPICRNAVKFARVNDEFSQCPKCSSVISYDRLIALGDAPEEHVRVSRKAASPYTPLIPDLTHADLVETGDLFYERQRVEPEMADHYSSIIGEVAVEVSRRRIAIEDFLGEEVTWADEPRDHMVVDVHGSIMSGPYPDFVTAYAVARYDRELRLAVPSDMLEDFEYRVV